MNGADSQIRILIAGGVEVCFAYLNLPSRIPADDGRVRALAQPGHEIHHCVKGLLLQVGAADAAAPDHPLGLPGLPAWNLTAVFLAQAIAHLLPERSIIVDDGATTTPLLSTARWRITRSISSTGPPAFS